MKFKINDKIQFIDLADHIKPSKSYNVTIQEAKVRETGFTEKQIEQIAQIIATTVPQIIATTVPPLIEAALVPINKRLDKIETRLDKIEERLDRIENLPTIKKEIAALNNNK